MRTTLTRSLGGLVLATGVLASVSAAAPAAPFAAVMRTIYVTVVDKDGAKVPDLTAADFTIKESGKTAEIVKVEPATGKIRMALMIEERLAPDGAVRQGLFEFIKRMQPMAEISVISVGLRNTIVVDYTQSGDALVGALNQLSLNPQPTSNLMEGFLEIGRAIEKQRPERPVIVAVAFSGGQAGGASANEVLSQLRQSGAGLYSVTLGNAQGAGVGKLGEMGDEAGREQVLGDGAKQTGARRIEVVSTNQVQKALQQLADDLSSQYVIKYALPEGTKMDKRISVSLNKKGLTMRAPVVVPDR
jgi:Ca-activated chloride channel homolog